MNQKYRRAVFIVVYALDKKEIVYAILKRKKHWNGWEFPKGGVENNELLEKAALRETFEETGRRVMLLKKYSVEGKYHYTRMLPDRLGITGQTYTLFSAQVRRGRIVVDSSEHYEGEWASFPKMMKMLKHTNQKKCLKIVHREILKSLHKYEDKEN